MFVTDHLEPLLHGSSALEVLGGGLDVPLDGLLAQVDHVRAEEGLAMLLEVLLIGIELVLVSMRTWSGSRQRRATHHAVQPRQQLLRAARADDQ